ncbi:MAG: hypothetical protein ACNA8H_09680 [Anaerolineales bacterium]
MGSCLQPVQAADIGERVNAQALIEERFFPEQKFGGKYRAYQVRVGIFLFRPGAGRRIMSYQVGEFRR